MILYACHDLAVWCSHSFTKQECGRRRWFSLRGWSCLLLLIWHGGDLVGPCLQEAQHVSCLALSNPSAVLMLWTQVQFQLPKGFAAMSDAWNKWQLTFSLRAELRVLHMGISRRQTQFSWALFFLDIWRKLSHYLGEIVIPISWCGSWFKCR